MTRAGVIVTAFALVAGCVHLAAPTSTSPVDAGDGTAALQHCIVDSGSCPALAKQLETRLLDRHDAPSAHHLAWQMTEALGRGDFAVVSATVERCRAGHRASCRALWWAIDRLYLGKDATLARAGECGLTDALAAAFVGEADNDARARDQAWSSTSPAARARARSSSLSSW